MALPSPRLLLRLADEPEVRIGDRSFLLGAREAAILCWLAIEGPTSRLQLAQVLWPDSSADAARAALRQRLFQLRRIAGRELVVGSHTLSLCSDVAHDLDGADRVLGAREPAIGAAFDAWLEGQRAARRSRVRIGLVERAERAERAGEWLEAVGHARTLLEQEPLSEDAHRRLIRLLYLSGERPQALLAFDRCEQLLKDEVGVAPSPETLALLQTIVRAEAAAADPAGSAARSAVPAAVLRPPLRVGQTRAADAIDACMTARAGASVCIVIGEPGMGKSRLLADIALAANAAERRVLLAAARPGDTSVPYALAARLLRSLIEEHALQPDAEQRFRLARVLPELLPPASPAEGGSRAGVTASSAALFEAAAARRLGGVVVDDLQWADDASVEWLQALLTRVPGLGWTLALRPHELRPLAREWVESLQEDKAVEAVTLEPLSPAEVGRMLESLSLPGLDLGAGRIDALHRRTGGNPMYVLETVKAAIAEPPRRAPSGGDSDAAPWPSAPNVVRLIQQRLRRLSPLARGVARCASVAGQDHDIRVACRVLGKRAVELADAWLELEAAHILRPDGLFTHDLIAEAALASLPAAVKASLHGDVARWLEAHEGEPGRVADHWLAAGQPRRAVPWLIAAGKKAHAAWRPDEAAPRFQQASAIHAAAGERRPAFEALFRGAAAIAGYSDVARIQPLHDALLDLADDEGQLAMATLFLLKLLVDQLRFDEAIAAGRRAAAQANAAGLPEIEGELRHGLAVIHWERRQLDDVAREERRALELLREAPSESRLMQWCSTENEASYVLGLVLCVTGNHDEGVPRLQEVRRIASRDGDQGTVRLVEYALAGFAIERGDPVRALALSHAAMATVDRPSLADTGVGNILSRHASLLALGGDLGAALDLHERAATVSGPLPTRHLRPSLQRALFLHRLGRRDLTSASLAQIAGRLQPDATVTWLQLRAVRLAIGEADDAADVLAQVARCEDIGVRVGVLCDAALAADAATALPVLDAELATATARGAKGVALSLAARRVALLHAQGRAREAAEVARTAWREVEAGVSCLDLMLPDLAALMCPALAGVDPPLARKVSARGRQWMEKAAATLPDAWRANYLARAPAVQGLQAAGVAVG